MAINADDILETIACATEENQRSALRSGQVVYLPPDGELWISGDIHDHRRNFDKFITGADLPNNPQRHIVLHELIHGDHYDENGAEDSWRMLIQAAELKCRHPDQVHFLLANHDLAQIHGEGIMKGGVSACEGFNKGIKRDFGEKRYQAQIAITELLLSFPLAIKTANGLFVTHSLPPDDAIENFDYTIFDRGLEGPDYKRRVGPVYQLIWGRRTTPAGAAAFLERVGSRIAITGHQPQEEGFAVNGPQHLIIASDHNRGVFVRLSLAEEYEMDAIVERIVRFVSYDPTQDQGPPPVAQETPVEELPVEESSERIDPEA